MLAQSPQMSLRAISNMLIEAIAAIGFVELDHQSIARNFGNDRRCCNRQTKRVTVDQSHLWHFQVGDERIQQERVRLAIQPEHGPLHCESVCRSHSDRVEFVAFDHPNPNGCRKLLDEDQRAPARVTRHEFGIAHRTLDLLAARAPLDRRSFEYHRRCYQRARQRAPPDFVDTGDQRIATAPECSLPVKLADWHDCRL